MITTFSMFFFLSISLLFQDSVTSLSLITSEQLSERTSRTEKRSVENVLSMIEEAMSEAQKGSRPKQVRFSVVGKRTNVDDIESVLKEIEMQLGENSKSNAHSAIPVRFSLTGRR